MKITLIGALAASGIAAVCLTGCSSQDPVTRTPYYHVGTPTNRSSVNSWELNREPYYTQPGVNAGTQVAPAARTASERGFEPYDPLAERVYSAMGTAGVHVKYISAAAKDGTVVLMGSADNHAQLVKALDVAGHVPGVKQVRNQLTVPQTTVAMQ
jgi:hypothetical protein